MNQKDTGSHLQDTAVSAIAAASKTPFKTAFMITLGIGLAHVLNFMLGVVGLGIVVTVVARILN